MEKKSTVLLIVIAVATLLVAVVGSTFAFFAIQETNNAKVNVTTTTAKGSDVFSATGSGALSLTVTNDVMQESATEDAEGNNTITKEAASAKDNHMVISLTAGSGKATCEYDLVWAENVAKTEGYIAYAKTAAAAEGALEYTIQAASTNTAHKVVEVNMDAIEDNVLGHFTIVDEYANANEATTETWTFTTKFYNLPVSQAIQMGKTYTGQVAVKNVVCSNSAN